MGMLIRRHRDRHKTEATEVAEVTSEDGPTRKEPQEQAKALGISSQGNKAALSARIAEHTAGKAHDAEADKQPPTEDDPGAGGDNPDAPAPEDGEGSEHTIVAPDPEDDTPGE